MKCPRCQGLMVQDQIYDIESPFLHIDILRCLNCGHTVDLTSLRARKEKEEKKENICSGRAV